MRTPEDQSGRNRAASDLAERLAGKSFVEYMRAESEKHAEQTRQTLDDMIAENRPIPDRVLRYDGRVDKPKPPACLECDTLLEIEKFDAGYCDEVCERLAMMKRIPK